MTNTHQLQEEVLMSIKRQDAGKGLDDMFGYNASDVENEQCIETNGVHDFDELLNSFDGYVNLGSSAYRGCNVYHTLAPDKINSFLKLTSRYDYLKNYSFRTGEFVSSLIQTSYLAGHTNFHLDLGGLKEIKYLGSRIYAVSNRQINLYVKGNVGSGFCSFSSNINPVIKGDIGTNSIYGSHNLTLVMKGEVGRGTGANSNQLRAFLDGKRYWFLNNYDQLYFGKFAREHSKFKKMMKEWEEKFK
jgi:hypothetical protein